MTEEINNQLQVTTWAIFNLCINIGLIASVMDQYPEQVQEGFLERLQMLQTEAERHTEEAQAFGEAYDDETEKED